MGGGPLLRGHPLFGVGGGLVRSRVAGEGRGGEAEAGADVLGAQHLAGAFVVVAVGEDVQRGGPGGAGMVGPAGGVLGVPEAGEGVGFGVAVAEVAEQGEGVLVAVGGLGVVAEVVVGVADAVPRGGFPPAVAD